ncbi:MAG: hypothetical protein KME16_21660 [Scytolyngbya sp. HA4215-MV1]|nr:hypothetical protein [Scytolyngbya sp. HA4215-MV1]
MNPQNSREEELRRKEQELRERELALRLKELESELHPPEPPLHQTTKHTPPESTFQKWQRQLVKAATFFGIVVAVIAAVRVASVLATAVIVGGIAFVAYKVFFEGEGKR